ncbi:DUF2946 family protein [Psychrosphaera ytuae]|uniref:DUF2946 family protein n=1 Tax=Psychrosphaera ytuae TaxID=2820710 RepID=A0A975DBT1_9GAMM|nr:DUF2946 family protein [Psychrosphaera ytuae]QTH62755.1 DUF2946 family protein [Psychrosphaera ytuae]
MKHIVHVFLVLCLALNLVAPSLGYMAGKTNQQLLCSTERQLWVPQSQSESEFIATGLALGFSLEQINEFGDGNALAIGSEHTQASQFNSGHCPLCVFDEGDAEIALWGFFTYSQVTPQTIVNTTSTYFPSTAFYLRPPNRAPPVLFSA